MTQRGFTSFRRNQTERRKESDRTLIFADLHSSESAKISVNQRSKFFAPRKETKRE